MQKKDLIEIRAHNPDQDDNFIYTTWLKALRFGNDWFERIPENIYTDNYRRVIEALLAKSTVKVACLKDDPTVILGYSVFENQTLHFIFVKPIWRRIRIAKDLVPKNIETMSHITHLGWAIAPHKWVFNPFAV